MPLKNPHTPGCEDCGDCIRFDGVSFRYGSQEVLTDIGFTIGCGEYVGVVGPNGGGKSTLIKLLIGVLEPSAGTVRVYGQAPRTARKGGRIGYVPQRVTQQEVAFPATVEEIVRSGRTPRARWGGRFTKEDEAAVEEALSIAEIGHLRSRQIGGLSGGERQRAFIARALAGEPHVLILDEPTTGVDPGARDRFHAFLRDLRASRGLTILYISHDVDVMAAEASSILCVDQRLLCHVPAKDFARDATLKALYGEGVTRIHHHHHH